MPKVPDYLRKSFKAKPVLLPLAQTKSAIQKGEIWKLPARSSPMWTEQWGVQGSAKVPYIVSRKQKIIFENSQYAKIDTWACSCPGWTKAPGHLREDCKHILSVQKKEKLFTASDPAAHMDLETAKAFKKFLLEQAEKGAVVPKKEKVPGLFENKGRKFR